MALESPISHLPSENSNAFIRFKELENKYNSKNQKMNLEEMAEYASYFRNGIPKQISSTSLYESQSESDYVYYNEDFSNEEPSNPKSAKNWELQPNEFTYKKLINEIYLIINEYDENKKEKLINLYLKSKLNPCLQQIISNLHYRLKISELVCKELLKIRQEILKGCSKEINDLRSEFVNHIQTSSFAHLAYENMPENILEKNKKIKFFVPGCTESIKRGCVVLDSAPSGQTHISYEAPENYDLESNSYTANLLKKMLKENFIVDAYTKLKEKETVPEVEQTLKSIQECFTCFYNSLDKPLGVTIIGNNEEISTRRQYLTKHRSKFSNWLDEKLSLFFNYISDFFRHKSKNQMGSAKLGENSNTIYNQHKTILTRTDKRILQPLSKLPELSFRSID